MAASVSVCHDSDGIDVFLERIKILYGQKNIKFFQSNYPQQLQVS